MVVLVFADIFGRPGRKAVAAALPELRAKYRPDFLLANVENLAGGRGVNRKTFTEMRELGFHGFTTGNHVWDNKEVFGLLESESCLLRPANFQSPAEDPCPGKGFTVISNGKESLFLINLIGRVFMDFADDPFAAVNRILAENPTPHPIIVDMHCDATSEKYAMGWHLDGRVAAVVGSHSHVQTADERILPGGTAYITDIGMTGSFDSVIGLRPPEVIKKYLTRRPQPTQVAKENPGICCVIIEIDGKKARRIERIRYSVDVEGGEGDEP
jgi:metallophosphoesterase (TIGR00282 family)